MSGKHWYIPRENERKKLAFAALGEVFAPFPAGQDRISLSEDTACEG